MKKVISVFLAFVFLMTLAACSGDGATADGSLDGTADTVGENTSAESGDDTVADDSESVSLDIVAVDCDICSVKITGVEMLEGEQDRPRNDTFFVKVRFENKSSDVKCALFVNTASINGIQWKNNTNTEKYHSETAAPGAVEEFEIPFSDYPVDESVIGRYSDIELSLTVCSVEDYNDISGEVIAENTVHICPYGEENATVYGYEATPNDYVIVDDEDITAIVTGYSIDKEDGCTVDLFFINKTDYTLTLNTYNESINGVENNPLFYAQAAAGKMIFTKIQWNNHTLEDEIFDNIDEIKFSLHVVGGNDDTTDRYSVKIKDITLNP